jgi:hypothetical protein
MQTKEVLLQGPSEAGLYLIYLKQLQSNKVQTKATFLSSTAFLSHFTAFLGVTAPLHIWHSRLGHPSIDKLKFEMTSNLNNKCVHKCQQKLKHSGK